MTTLRELLSRRQALDPAVPEQPADAALLEERYEDALLAYAQGGVNDARVGEKRGYCLCLLERWSEAKALLESQERELSSYGLALLALACADGWDNRYKLADETKREVEAHARAALAREPTPPSIAYTIYLWFARSWDAADVDEVATRAIELYPTWRPFRLRWAYERLYRGEAAQAYDGLLCCLEDAATDEYLWVCAMAAEQAGRHADAAGHLSALLSRFAVHETRDSNWVHVRLAHARLLAEAGDLTRARECYTAIEQESATLEKSLRVDLARHLANYARMQADGAALNVALESLLSVWSQEPHDNDPNRALSGEPEPLWFPDGTIGSLDPTADLAPHRETLLASLKGDSRGLLRYLFAEAERYRSDGYNRQQYAATVAQARAETAHPLVEGAYALACTFKKRPDWKAAGRAWTRYARSCHATQQRLLIEEPLDHEAVAEKKVVAYAEGMLGEFEAAPSPYDYTIFAANVRDALCNCKAHRLFRRLAQQCVSTQPETEALFDAGLAAHWCDDPVHAEAMYWATLERSATHYSALHNVLLLLRSPKSAGSLAKAAALVEAYPADNAQDKARLHSELERARAACVDPAEVERTAVRAELARYPSVIEVPPDVAKTSLQDAVALLTLLRACGAQEESLVLPPFGDEGRPFSPTLMHRRWLFRLLQVGLVAVAGDTTLRAFSVENGRVCAYRFERVSWQLSPATLILVDQLQAASARTWWPRRWCEDAPGLAHGLAEEEVMQYLFNAADERGWPPPDDEEKMRALTRGLLAHVSVSEAFYLIYLGAMAAADYKARYPINDQQAANAIVLRTSQRLDRWTVSPWPLKQYSRTNAVPRSWLSIVLHDEFTKLGERAFTDRLAGLSFPPPRSKNKVSRERLRRINP